MSFHFIRTPIKHSRRWFLLWLSVVSVAGCNSPERPQQITISNPPAFRPSNPTDIKTLDQALAAVVTVCRDDLGLPVVDPLHVYLYKNSASFAFYGHGGVRASDVAHRAASARGNEIHVDLEKVGKGAGLTSIWLWAHEYAHNVHYKLANPENTPFFVSEGFADWLAARVLHFLRWRDYATTQHQIIRELIRHRDVLPDIASLHDNWFWKDTVEQSMGIIRARDLAFLAMDRLIQQKGLAAMVAYLRNGDFKNTFAISLEQFTAELKNSLFETTRSRRDVFSAGRPDWKIGYKWTYLKTDFGRPTTILKEVVGEDIFRGTAVFVVRTPEEETLYDKQSLGFVGSWKNAKLISDVDKINPFLSWPLEPGKEWRISFKKRDLIKNSTSDYDQILVVAGVEKIHVPAGNFDGVKLEAFGAVTGRLRAEYWYSPKVKWFVKTRTYGDLGVTEEELSWVELQSLKQ